MSKSALPGVTAVISTRNRRDELRATLDRLRDLRYPGLGVVVVDNASDDGTRALLRREYPDIRVVPHSDNRPLRGYNIGFSLVTTPYALALDDDSAPRPGALEAMVERLERVPEAGAAAANIIGPDGQSEWGSPGTAVSCSDWYNLIGCGFLARASVLRRTGGYNESFELYYNDLDLALRILALGHTILYSAHWVVDHRRTPIGRIPLRKLYFAMRNFPSLVRCHLPGWRRWDVLAGHTAITLRQAAREGCLARSIPWFWQGLTLPPGRRFAALPGSLAAARFIDEYSLVANLRRLLLPGRPAALPTGVAAPVAPAHPPGRMAEAPEPPPAPCYWRIRIDSGDTTALRDSAAVAARSAADAAGGCDCAASLGWYRSPWEPYQRHLMKASFLSCNELRSQRIAAAKWHYRPVISLLTAVHRVDLEHLEECLLSVERQTYPGWELCLVDDGSGVAAIRERLQSFADRHGARVRLALRDENVGIARTLQQALEAATGEYVMVLDHDDRLAPEALHEVVAHLNLHPETDWIYSDNDKISVEGERWYHHFKPDWSPDLLLSYNYAHHLSVLRSELVQEVGGFREEFDGAQDYDLYLRVAERTTRVGHLPRVLYSWRQTDSSVAVSMGAKPYVADSGLRALRAALRRRRDPGEAEHDTLSWEGNYRVRRTSVGELVDLVVMDAEPASDDGCRVWSSPSGGVRVQQHFHPLPGERAGETLARALRDAHSPYLLVAYAAARPGTENVLAGLVSCLGSQGVGAAAPAVMDGAGWFDHCGLALAPGGTVLYPLRGLPAGKAHYGAYGALVRTVSAVSPVCVLFNVEALRRSGAFDATLGGCGAVIDACFGLRQAGQRVVADGGIRVVLGPGRFDAGPELAEGGGDLLSLVLKRPRLTVAGDPYYNLNLGENPADFGVGHV